MNARTGATRVWMLVSAAAGAVLLAVALWRYASAPIHLPGPRETPPPPSAIRADFVGSERCASCHTAQFAAWKSSTHGRAGGRPSPATVIAPFGGAAIRFANARVMPRARGGAYDFVVERAGQPAQTIRVDGVIGGGHIYGGGTQGFVTKMTDGTLRFLPFEWSRQNRVWFCNTNSRSGRGWAPITPDVLLEECGDWPPVRIIGDLPRYANCQSCHASQATVAIDSTAHQYTTELTSLAINCESCHGPAREHVRLAESGGLATDGTSGLMSLASLSQEASVRVCYQCHAVKDRLRAGFLSGDTIARFYSLRFPMLGDRPLHPDGRVRTFAYQEGQSWSDCYVNGGMTCVSCHDPHGQNYRDANGTALPGRFDDRQCTSCHASKAEAPAAHTRHPPTVSCTSCHMPFRQELETRALGADHLGAQVVTYARSDHTISIPRPALDSALGFASACAACHTTLSVAEQEQRIRDWWGEIKPLNPIVAAQYRVSRRLSADSAAPLLLGDAAQDVAGRNPDARFAGVALFLDGYVTPDTDLPPAARSRLRELARSADVDIRAAALATLHLASGDDRATRRVLAAALRADGTHDAALRARWSLALAYMGDMFAAQGSFAKATTSIRRALEVQPSSARLWLSLANAARDGGDLTGAVASYKRSIALEPAAPLAWVNFGIALGALGDTVGAVRSFNQALALDAGEPLAWFNLGNVVFVRGDLARAAQLYGRAAELDPSIVPAHFQLARIRLLRGDERGALSSLRNGLAFDSSDVSARAMADRLSKRLGSVMVPPR